MNYDRKIIISVGESRHSMNWKNETTTVSALYRRLEIPGKGFETLAQYLSMTKAEQDRVKDNGGFVGGEIRGQRRKTGAVVGRDIITLDLDNIPIGGTDEIKRRVEALNCGYCIYSTRKHSAQQPRLRVLFPSDRTVTAEEYEPIARKMAEFVGMEYADQTTFEVTRLMYWPSCCADSEFVFVCADKPFISADRILAMYTDWRDITSWAGVPDNHVRLAAKQGDPTTKGGVIGAFCRSYDIFSAIDAFLPNVYTPVDTAENRLTFINGSTSGGAVVYEEGKFLYSHHATDPCSMRLVNAFDLVRLHKFDDLDAEAKHDTPVNKLPSYIEMCKLACADESVSAIMATERMERTKADFEGAAKEYAAQNNAAAEKPADVKNIDWVRQLAKNTQTGKFQPTSNNIKLVFENDEYLRGKFALNRFSSKIEVLGALPWDFTAERRELTDNDNHGLYWFFETGYDIASRNKIDSELSLCANRHGFNPVQDYLNGLTWDQTPRLDTFFIDYLGAADTRYTRAVTRIGYVAAVARAMVPGIKYDTMVVLSGPTGIGKSTVLRKMGKDWFSDGVYTFEGKEASELLQGVWIAEISELDAFRKTDDARIKQFLSMQTDRFRAAYGRNVEEKKRCCVFFGTLNPNEFLRDMTGNRRFLPIDTGVLPKTKNFQTDLDGEVDQLWAEAVTRWRLGEPLYLSGELEQAAKAQQESHRETNAREGLIRDFIEREIPENWQSWEFDRRMMFWSGTTAEKPKLVPRNKICALEIWCECFVKNKADIRNWETAEINGVLNTVEWLEKSKDVARFGYCGRQRGFNRRSHPGD